MLQIAGNTVTLDVKHRTIINKILLRSCLAVSIVNTVYSSYLSDFQS